MGSTVKKFTLATFRIGNNVLSLIDEHTYRLHKEQARNTDIDSVVSQCISLLTKYLEDHYPDNNIHITSHDIVNTENPSDLPLDSLIIAYSTAPDGLNEQIKKELMKLASAFVSGILDNQDDLFSTQVSKAFTSEQNEFIKDHIEKFIHKKNGKSISKPFICEILGDSGTSVQIPVKGGFRKPVLQNSDEKHDDIFFAHSDGTKGSDMTIFLKPVKPGTYQVSSVSKEFTAEKASHTKIAALAYASDLALVKVIAYEKTDEKGKVRRYIKEISPASLEHLSAESEKDGLIGQLDLEE